MRASLVHLVGMLILGITIFVVAGLFVFVVGMLGGCAALATIATDDVMRRSDHLAESRERSEQIQAIKAELSPVVQARLDASEKKIAAVQESSAASSGAGGGLIEILGALGGGGLLGGLLAWLRGSFKLSDFVRRVADVRECPDVDTDKGLPLLPEVQRELKRRKARVT